MTSRTRYGRAVLLMLAASFSLASMRQASAQTADQNADIPAAEAAGPSVDDADTKDLQLDWSQLNVDAFTLATPVPKARLIPQAGTIAGMSWSSRDNPNGSAAVSVKQPLSPVWDARIGADMTVTREPTALTTSELLSEKLANGGSQPQSSGTAYAAITAPGVGSIWDKTAVEARVDPSQEQSKVGTSLSKSLPLNEQYALTFEDGANVIQQTIVPVPGLNGRPLWNYETEQSAKLSIADTGTSFSAGQSLCSTDDKWLRKIGAEQKLFGGVSLSGSIAETAFGPSNKSLTAGYKHSW